VLCVHNSIETNGCSSVIRSERCVRHGRPRHSILTVLQRRFGVCDTALAWLQSYICPIELKSSSSTVLCHYRSMSTAASRKVQSLDLFSLSPTPRTSSQSSRSTESGTTFMLMTNRRTWTCMYKTSVRHGLHFKTVSLTSEAGVRREDCSSTPTKRN